MRGRAGRKQRRPKQPAAPPGDRWSAWGAVGLFAVALAVRLLFWQSGPDATWAYSASFKGDALVWLDYARSLQAGLPFELGLPIHPPGTGYLLSWLWDGTEPGLVLLRFVWSCLGAATVVLFAGAIARPFGIAVAAVAGGWMAASTGLVALSSSLNAEAPYLVLVAGSFVLLEDLVHRPRPWLLAAWGALQGLACLFRVEHALFVGLVLALLTGCWWRSGRALRPLGIALLAVAAPLVPWHARAWSGIARFNRVEPEAGDARRLYELPGLAWDEGALARRAELPAFARPTSAAFVAATVLHRGGRRVRGEDFAVLEEAFGYVPRPLGRRPFVSSYGPLNFALANNAGARGGFSPALLEEPPPLRGGVTRYPPGLVAGLPPPQLALVYPPHLRLFNEGYSIGGGWILRNPGAFLALAFGKLRTFWSGASLGFSGYGLPLGASGTRRAVDLVVPDDGPLTLAWRIAVLAACGAGAAAAWSRLALHPWLLFLLSKLLTTALFFGYARTGATVVPVVALLAALAAARWIAPRFPGLAQRGALLAALAGAALLGVEGLRCWQQPRVLVDGREVGPRDPFPADVHRDQKVEVR
jgi:hypothetical protein